MTNVFRFFLLLTGLLLGQQRPGAAQVFEWAQVARRLTGNSLTTKPSAVTDAAGNTYSSIQFLGQLQVGTQTLTSPSSPSTVVIKYAPNGQITWTKILAGIGVEELALDPATGGFYCAGSLQAGATWDGSPVTASGPYFYGKASAAGAMLWTNSLPAIYTSPSVGYTANEFFYGLNLAVDGPGNLYLMGCLQNAGTIAGTALNNQTLFLLQTDANGSAQWVRQLHDNGTNSRSGLINAELTAKPGGGCLITARFVRTIYFGAGTTGPTIAKVGTGQDGLLASIDAAGTLQWGRVVTGNTGTPTYVRLNDAAVDAAGNCYITGGSVGTAVLGSSSLPSGFLLAKYDPAGNVAWVRGQQTNTTTYGAMGARIVTDAAGAAISVAVFDSTSYSQPRRPPVQIGGLTMSAVFNVVRFDGQGEAVWAVGETPVTPLPFLRSADLGLDGSGNLYWSGDISARGWPVPPTVAVHVGAHTTAGDGIILSKLQNQSNSLVGEVYQDLNANGQRDTGEPAFTGLAAAQVGQNGTDTFYPIRPNGQLQAFASPGSYTLTLATGSLPRYHTITQPAGGSYTGSFSGSNQVQSGQVFGLSALTNQPDVRVTLTPYTPVRPGFLTRYRLTLENMGTTTASGTVTATLDGRMAYVSSAPAGTQSGNTLSWNYSNLLPQAVLHYDVQFSLPINVTLGTLLTHTATATLPGELTPADNTTTLQQTVVASFDPNDINVDYTQLTPQQVAARQRLRYRVRFQNMGTDTAFVVTIKDTLDASRLQVSSLRMVSQSHNCIVESSSRGILTIRLINPKLPPRSTNALGSQGYILFEAVPLRTLVPGDVIPNHAHITFDYNAPLRTNTATTTVLLPTATRPGQVALRWDAYPNPVTDALTITLPAGTTATAELLDALGRPVRQQPLTGPAPTLDLRTLPAGLYLLRLRTPQGITAGRSIVRQ